MKKRNLFAELTEGFEALSGERQGKRTLRTHEAQVKAAPDARPPNCLRCVSACTCRAPYSQATCAPIPARWRTGNRAGPNPTLRQHC